MTVETIPNNAPANAPADLVSWVEEVAALTKPDAIYWVDGSEAERDRLNQELVDSGVFIKLNEEKNKNVQDTHKYKEAYTKTREETAKAKDDVAKAKEEVAKVRKDKKKIEEEYVTLSATMVKFSTNFGLAIAQMTSRATEINNKRKVEEKEEEGEDYESEFNSDAKIDPKVHHQAKKSKWGRGKSTY